MLFYFELSHIVIGICWDNRYLGLFGDHIVPAILYRYTSELTRPDLVNAKGKPLIAKARLKAVWTRLANRMATVVADTSMVTISPQYATHFYDMYINCKENAKMGDQMKILMLSLPFMVRDLIQPEVNWDISTYTGISWYPRQGRSQEGVDTCRAEQHSAESHSEESGWLRLDNIRVCGMGV